MYYFLYRTTNTLNGKSYTGVHKTGNLDDGYLGSGKRFNNALKKYGSKNFTREILEWFDNSENMYKREAEVVNADFLLREDVYNIRLGGLGGFDHINNNPVLKAKRKEASIKYNKENGIGGTGNWTEESLTKVIAAGKKGLKTASVRAQSKEAIEKRKHTFKKNNHQQGENNSQFGLRVYVDSAYEGKLTAAVNSQKFIPGKQPTGWITVAEWRDNKKIKDSPNYGRHWYNNGIENFYCYDTDERISSLQLQRGRLNCKFIKNSLS